MKYYWAIVGFSLAACAPGAVAPPATPVATAAELAPSAPTRERVDLTIGTQALSDATGNEVLPVPADASKGFAAEYKAKGAFDMRIPKLDTPMQAARQAHRELRIAVAPTTTYRILVEVLYTAGQNDIQAINLFATGKQNEPLLVVMPTMSAGSSTTQWITALVDTRGTLINFQGQTYEQGCQLATRASGAHPSEGRLAPSELEACVQQVAASSGPVDGVIVSATADIDYATVAAVARSAIAGTHGRVLRVAFAIPR
jgi:biopolymer transport protein ExbD